MRNLQEQHHGLGRRVFHGRKGEVYRAYHDGMEDQLGTLGLVLNCITLWNTIYLDHALATLREQGYPVRDADAARLSVSRLAVSPGGRHLLMAGWVWHPHGIGRVFDLQQALTDPSVLDGRGVAGLHDAVDAEVAAACWLDNDRVVMAATTEEALNGEDPDALSPGQLGVWSMTAWRLAAAHHPHPPGQHDDRLRGTDHHAARSPPAGRPDRHRRGRMARRDRQHQTNVAPPAGSAQSGTGPTMVWQHRRGRLT